MRIGLSDNSGIIVPLKDCMSDTRKEVPIEQQTKKEDSTKSAKIFLNDLKLFLPTSRDYFLI